MNNKGLEALANLASASTTQASDGNISASTSMNERSTQAALSENPLQPQANNAQAVSLNSLSTQQLQQLLNATGIGNTAHNLLTAANLNMLGLQQPVQQPQPETSFLSQLAYLQQMLGRTHSHAVHPFNSSPLLYSGLQSAQQEQLKVEESSCNSTRPQVLPTNPCGSISSGASSQASGTSKMPPPPPPSQVITANADRAESIEAKVPPGSPPHRQNIAPIAGATSGDEFEPHYSGDKKFQKRAANRLSAQLSRKRKKQFMEELKDENDDLRRKEQILKSIPDLIVVFDSTGKLWFVSHSVSRFLKFSAEELEGTSIWERLCEDSVRLLKAAFMDSLAARQPDSDTAPLGSGFWELRLVDRDGSQKIITLNGVVHFAGDRPECVCSIRPSEEHMDDTQMKHKTKSDDSKSDPHHKSLIRIKPQQSVVSSGSGSGSSDSSSSRRKGKRGNHGIDREPLRISDSGNSSAESESASGSGSSDD